MNKTFKIVGLSGSLKKNSTNTALLKALAELRSPHTSFEIFEALDTIPHFNPDLDGDTIASVVSFRKLLKECDGVIICTPEYAFGIPGSLKNALDWTVSSGDFYEKPVATISASPLPSGADKAHAALRLTLTAMGSTFIDGGSLTIAATRNKIDGAGKIIDQGTTEELKNLLLSLEKFLVDYKARND
jgi:chromate reductase, NAD(P)H dehydrogenase (quinone)